MASSLVETFAQLLGLDDATVRDQIWPHLNSIASRPELTDYLHNLLGPGPAQASFISSYLASRFPPPPPPPTSSTRPPKTTTKGSKPAAVWGKQSAAAPALHPDAAGPTRGVVSEQDRRELERQFGSGGKVYIKNREEEIWGGGGGGGGKKGSRSQGGSGSVTPVPRVASPVVPPTAKGGSGVPVHQKMPTTLARTPAAGAASAGGKGKGAKGAKEQAFEYDPIVNMSEEASKELLEIDRAIRGLTASSTSAAAPPTGCFCQAREHPLHPHAPSCPSCALILCLLNSPILPCPSCAHSPLLPQATLAPLLASLSLRRTILISDEAARITRRREEEERERAAIRFPSLAPGVAPSGGGAPRGYASMAGAGPGLDERVERPLALGVSVNGRQFGRMPEPRTEGKVLRLDMKTKKVKLQVRQPVGAKKVEEVVGDEEEKEEGVGWVDKRDDGVVRRKGVKRAEVEAVPQGRPFLNITLDEKERPVWVEEVEEEEEEVAVQDVVVEVEKGVPGAAPTSSAKRSRKKKATPAPVVNGPEP